MIQTKIKEGDEPARSVGFFIVPVKNPLPRGLVDVVILKNNILQ